MKKNIRNFGSATVFGVMLIISHATGIAQTTVQSTTTAIAPSAGTVSEFSPDSIVVKTETSPAPVTYSYTKTTTYVDEAGAPVSVETVKSGLPVTMYYIKDGDRMIASKVVVRRSMMVVPANPVVVEKKTTTTTTTDK